ncbi:hypothetical protein OQX63_17310 [Pedobacter sp. PF22-3]|uniref:hypothetical protein n=1 Tax=Pedobacter sp. PF22-3 TaxID=2994467 RepID=UPI0022456327|nr:hypothetical protein [Pedobacter sp. PF22-3]MCX2495252.1 hypothetical protein [Pedobacter sp. PF22-3]
MALIRPRLNDYHSLPFTQAEVDFAIPFLDEDIPLYLDPFLLWKITSQQDNALHTSLVNSFNQLGRMFVSGKEVEAKNILIELSECEEVGFGSSKTRQGKKIGKNLADDILSLYKNIPQINKQGFQHFEEIQLLVDNISKDRISDIACCLVKSFLIDFTLDQCDKHKIPYHKVNIPLYNYKKSKVDNEDTFLPINPLNSKPILLVPKRWLRFSPWINYDDYFSDYYIKDIEKEYDGKLKRVGILNFNRNNYNLVESYINQKEAFSNDCTNDPLFSQIPVLSSNRKLKTVLELPTGKTNNADIKYEDNMVQLLSSMLYPHLDFAKEQSRTVSGSQIRDIIFYNNRSYDFLADIYDNYQSRQLVIELKNVASIEREHINQLNRYLSEEFGKFGILFTRNKPSKALYQNTIDLWAGQRRCILILDDEDLKLMCGVYDSKQRHPIEIIKKKYIEFTRSCPA